MVKRLHLIIAVFVLMFDSSQSFLFTKDKVGCLMSQWSEWSGVYGFGERAKERVILRYPSNGGEPCPTSVSITGSTANKPTIQETANMIITSFLQRNPKTNSSSPGGIVKRAVPCDLFRDLVVIIDSSGSIGSHDFELAKEKLGDLLALLCPDPDPFDSNRLGGYNQAALIQFSDFVREEFDFDDNHNIAKLKASIKSVPFQSGGTCTGDALYKAIQMFTTSKGMRQGTKHEVLILTDGQSNCGKSLSTVLPTLQAKASVFGLMIGSFSSSGKIELTSYVSRPTPQHLFAVDSFQDLQKLLDAIKIQLDKNNPCASFKQ